MSPSILLVAKASSKLDSTHYIKKRYYIGLVSLTPMMAVKTYVRVKPILCTAKSAILSNMIDIE